MIYLYEVYFLSFSSAFRETGRFGFRVLLVTKKSDSEIGLGGGGEKGVDEMP